MRAWVPQNGPTDASATAICIAGGQLRTLPWIIDIFESSVLQPLQPAGVFIHASTEWSTRDTRVDDAKLFHTDLESAIIDVVTFRLRPVGLELLDDVQVSNSSHPYQHLSKTMALAVGPQCHLSNCPTLFMRFAGCARDILRHEREFRHASYTWILQTRADPM